jgi:hypothetical protein
MKHQMKGTTPKAIMKLISFSQESLFMHAGVFYCGRTNLAKDLKKLSIDMSHKTRTRFHFHKEYF